MLILKSWFWVICACAIGDLVSMAMKETEEQTYITL